MKKSVSLFTAISLSFLVSCSHRGSLKVKNFQSTNSPCLDATIINMTASGCKSLETVQGETYTSVRCLERPEKALSQWTELTFYISPSTGGDPPEGAQLICADSALMVSFEAP